MLGSGRPFLLEIQNPRVLSSELSVKEMEEKVNTLGGELVREQLMILLLLVLNLLPSLPT